MQMDSSWAKYNMKRVQFGFDAWVDPSDPSAFQEQHDKDVISRIDPRMVKLTGFDAHGNVVQCASGFQYTKDATLIVTCSCNHVRYQPQPQPQPQEPVARFIAKYVSDGVEEEVQISTPPHPLYDLMVLSGSRRASTDFLADNPITGDTVYVSGIPPDGVHVCHSKGMIGSATPVSLTVDAYADNGWSGGPVVNRRGRLVGVITQGVGNTIKRPEAMSTQRLHDFLVVNNLPGLSA